MSASNSAAEPVKGACVVAVDLGTQTTRAALMARDGSVIDDAATPVPLLMSAPGVAEQRPADWWDATVANLSALMDRNPDAPIASVAVGAQMHGVVPVGTDGESLCEQVAIWSDKRAADVAARLNADPGIDALTLIARNRPEPAWSGLKIAWFREHLPEVYAAADTFLVAKDFVNLKLTGRACTDPTEASGSWLMDGGSDAWSERLLEAVGVDGNKLPPIVGSCAPIGGVSRSAAELTGLPAGTPVVAGAGDMLCHLLGTGLTEPNRFSEISGTASIIASYAEEAKLESTVMNLRAAGEGWVRFGISDAGGIALRWFAEELCEGIAAECATAEMSRYDVLCDLASGVSSGSFGLTFLPFLLGERSLGNAAARATLIGLTPRHGRAEIFRAILEGVCFDLKRYLEAMGPDPGAAELRVSGGGATSPLWNQIRADVYGLPVQRITSAEGGLLGTAMLAQVGAGWYPDVASAAEALVVPADVSQPDPGSRGSYAQAYRRFRSAHAAADALWESWEQP
jgi:xylulokinase